MHRVQSQWGGGGANAAEGTSKCVHALASQQRKKQTALGEKQGEKANSEKQCTTTYRYMEGEDAPLVRATDKTQRSSGHGGAGHLTVAPQQAPPQASHTACVRHRMAPAESTSIML